MLVDEIADARRIAAADAALWLLICRLNPTALFAFHHAR